jgi:hypothetical protein
MHLQKILIGAYNEKVKKRIDLFVSDKNYSSLIELNTEFVRSNSSIVSMLLTFMAKKVRIDENSKLTINVNSAELSGGVKTSLQLSELGFSKMNELIESPRFSIEDQNDNVLQKSEKNVINAVVVYYRGQFQNQDSFVRYSLSVSDEAKKSHYFKWLERNKSLQAKKLAKIREKQDV